MSSPRASAPPSIACANRKPDHPTMIGCPPLAAYLFLRLGGILRKPLSHQQVLPLWVRRFDSAAPHPITLATPVFTLVAAMCVHIAIPEPTGSDSAFNQRSLPAYLAALRSAGATPIIVPLHEHQDRVARLLASVQAVLLPGSNFD